MSTPAHPPSLPLEGLFIHNEAWTRLCPPHMGGKHGSPAAGADRREGPNPNAKARPQGPERE
jgi:hypothetical protein